jgi:hypothetical protein
MTDDELTIRRGYPPQAHRLVAVDYDGTLFPFGYVDDEPAPLPGAIEAVARLKAHDYRVWVYTSRLSPTWVASSGYTLDEMRERIEKQLRKYHIPFDGITGEKIAAAWYVDDRAIRFDGNWPEIVDFIVWRDADLG